MPNLRDIQRGLTLVSKNDGLVTEAPSDRNGTETASITRSPNYVQEAEASGASWTILL